MCMTMLGIVDIGINASLKDLLVIAWFRWHLICGSCNMYVEEGGNVTKIEQATIPQPNRL